MGSRIRRSACALSVALVGVLAIPSPAIAQTDECPGNIGRIGGVCQEPSPSPSPTPTRTSTPNPSPQPTGSPTPTRTRTNRPRPTQTATVPQPTQTAVQPSPSASTPFTFPTTQPTYPTEFPTEFPLPGEERPVLPTAPGLAAAPASGPEQGAGMQILTLLVLAGGIAFLLIRARVRRWMIGI